MFILTFMYYYFIYLDICIMYKLHFRDCYRFKLFRSFYSLFLYLLLLHPSLPATIWGWPPLSYTSTGFCPLHLLSIHSHCLWSPPLPNHFHLYFPSCCLQLVPLLHFPQWIDFLFNLPIITLRTPTLALSSLLLYFIVHCPATFRSIQYYCPHNWFIKSTV